MDATDKIYKTLEDEFYAANLERPIRLSRYQPGETLVYSVTSVDNAEKADVRLSIEKFVGGGFAGQVYRVKVLDIQSSSERFSGLKVSHSYAMKILIPPSGFSKLFRDALYFIGFQGPFQLQVNPTAARAGALWQKFIRRGAKICLGDERSVVDIYATFIDSRLGSCGELSEWVEGRTWQLEVDEHIDLLKAWQKGKEVDEKCLGSLEYREKYEFMKRFVRLLHDMGGHEFARQYEWSTWKSQPNCLKRVGGEITGNGLTAVDFRAGLTLLPFLPMSPGDFRLILTGLLRGSLVQFDRGNLKKLQSFVQEHEAQFDDMQGMLEELKESEEVYRNSIPDITHNHVRLFYSPTLWSTILKSTLTGWKVRNLVDQKAGERIQNSKLLFFLFFLLGLIPLFGRVMRRLWARRDWRRHYTQMLTSFDYFRRALKARAIETYIDWHQTGRMDFSKSPQLVHQTWRLIYHIPLSFLPVSLHKILTDFDYAKQRLAYYTVRPVKLYFSAALREEWLLQMLQEGKRSQMLSDEDAETILSQLKEPFIQKYLKSLAVHVCTLPVTQVVSILVAAVYIVTHPEIPRAQAYTIGLGIIAIFQILPISPGSIVRGLYVLYLVFRERNFKDYNIAVFLGFFKYIGYLAFPIQMTYRYPALARFMAGYWATEAVHVVPVFGERGALLEHKVYGLFYNWPLTIRRRMRMKSEWRATQPGRHWHVPLLILVGAITLAAIDIAFYSYFKQMPELKDIWLPAVFIAMFCGVCTARGAGGSELGKRVVEAMICGVMIGGVHAAYPLLYDVSNSVDMNIVLTNSMWRVFLYTVFSVVGALYVEAFSTESIRTLPRSGS